MSLTVCLSSRGCLNYPNGGGYLWIFLNWALGLRSAGCNVVWLEEIPAGFEPEKVYRLMLAFKERLRPYGLADSLALHASPGQAVPPAVATECLDLAAATEAAVLLNFRYGLASEIVGRFRRSALVDIDPGLLQIWMAKGLTEVAEHDVYLTTGEHVRDLTRTWHHVPPCVSLDWWTPAPAPVDASFTTVGHWYAGGWIDADEAADDKRSGFLPLLDLPKRTSFPLELALDLAPDDPQTRMLEASGWRVRSAREVAATPWDYQRYLRESLGEFSCSKPAYRRLANAWISDRTPCYLASGRPTVVEHTGPSSFLPDDAGLLRFRNREEAAMLLERVVADYERQSAQARALAEEYFDARRVAARALELAL
jgi:hypothetical protein